MSRRVHLRINTGDSNGLRPLSCSNRHATSLAERAIAAIMTIQERVMGSEDIKDGIRSFVERPRAVSGEVAVGSK
jgi:hypothetical protein